MKIAYLISNRPEFVNKVTQIAGPDPLIIATGADGLYSPRTLAGTAEVEALMVANEPVTEQLLAGCPSVKIIQRFGVGYEKLDLAAAARRGIPCCNLAGVNKEAVAEHGILLMLALARNLLVGEALTRKTSWGEARLAMVGAFELTGKTLGIIGLGDTGFELAKRARAFGMQVCYNDIREIPAENVEAVGARLMEKEELLGHADIVSINVNYNETSANLIDAKAIALLKPEALLICCARGGIVDEAALADALNGGRLAGAGIDVFSSEPFPPDNPLLAAKNVVLTPHMAGVTREASERNFQWAFDNVRRVLERGEKPHWVVNGL